MAYNRDNAYWRGRLLKDGHKDLLDRVERAEISMYKARQLAGYLAKKPQNSSGKLSYHWGRASHAERKQFVLAHAKEVNRVLREVRDDALKMKAQKPRESDQK